jgi:hypothetical protein
MATFKGKLDFEDIGAGAWVLVTESGERFTLRGEVPSSLRGRRVTVKGKKSDDGFGFSMLGGDAIDVAKITAS